MAHAPDLEPHKRKRESDDGGIPTALPPLQHPQQAHQQGGNAGFINYLSRSAVDRLTLLPGEPDTFADIVRSLSGYESVWERHESFAASLGAKLTGPRLLKGFEKFFEGPIKTSPPQPFSQLVTWLDICTFAKANPADFVLTTLPDGSRCCQFVCKGLHVEISEDDWRFILSGALSRIPLEHPLDEDETAELATLDILEQRASMLWRRADEVSARARILHHRLGQRRQDILRRRKARDGSLSPVAASQRFHSINHQPSTASSASTTPSAAHPSSSQGPPYDLHADLLQQFIAASTPLPPSHATSVTGLSQGRTSPSMTTTTSSSVTTATTASHSHQRLSISGGSSSAAAAAAAGQVDSDTQVDTIRPLITQKIDKLIRGDPIAPPCDRCRRLKLPCVKHLTACQGCTKKHAKCSWKAVLEDEAATLKREMGILVGMGGTSEDADTEMDAPGSRASEVTAGSAEGSRPASRSGAYEGSSSTVDRHGLATSPPGRIELPPMRMRTSLPQGQGPAARGETPQNQASGGCYIGDRLGYMPSNPSTR